MTAVGGETPSVSLWFDGSIALAVETANTQGSILMVCLVQDDSESRVFEDRFSDTQVASVLSGLNLISLRLVKDSVEAVMFGQIFPIVMVPSLYLIRNGLLTDFMNSKVNVDQMLTRIERAVDGHFQIPPPPNAVVQPSTTASTTTLENPTSAGNPTANASASTPMPSSVSEPPQLMSPVFDANSPMIEASSSVNPSIQSSTAASPAGTNNAQVLKDLMKERQLKREKEEQQAEKQREIDRRASSRSLSDAQKELQDMQSKKLKDQLEKDKQEEAEYRKRVKMALEEDKTRRQAEKEKAKAAARAQTTEQVLTPGDIRAQNSGLMQARNDAGPALAYESSRLNIRLFDGSSIRNTFKATDTLEQVRKWINDNQEDCDDAYNIVQLIPSRTFTDESKMLRDLDLCPSATLVLKRAAMASSAYSGSEDGAIPTLLQYSKSALSLAGRMASSAYSTVSYYNPLASFESDGSSSSSSTRPRATDRASESAENSTNLE
ncbi:hypothetical protein BGZ65_001046 [Modicella reniformis]|uniref:UBX domain-containing protein n=1 Tax=Modicella reniformis TaxID=1440133 RepID=A0A9P6SUA9_9FUNG|nr:hypothetical protein BGZ65_001046 [Modicella reniformis]